MRGLLPALLLTVGGLAGCHSGGNGAVSAANQANVFSVLKAVASMQMMHLNERGEFAPTFVQLQGTRQMDQVSAAVREGKSAYGYVFKDLTRDEGGGRLGRTRYGLSAVPERAGGGVSYLLLIDAGAIRIDEQKGVSISQGDAYYKTAAAQAPFDAWPGSSTLARWEEIRMRTPQEAVKEAQGVKKDFDASRR